jgi:cyanophycin synthetase
MPAAQLAAKLSTFIPPALMRRVVLPPGEVSFAQLAATLARAMQDLHGRQGLDLQIQQLNGGACRIVLGYHDAQASMMALETGLELATAFLNEAGGRRVDLQPIEARMQKLAAVLMMRQPDRMSQALIRAARLRGIPVYPVSPGSRIWLYGQGRAGFHGYETATHSDALTASKLSRNKALASQLVMQLGFPAAKHGVVSALETARLLAAEIGYPVVVKPSDGSKGKGVTANIAAVEELNAAFARAEQLSPGHVIVERHVAGDDHRLTVIGGKLIWASCLSPPRVIGDGQRTIAELIEAENTQRRKSPVADIASAQLVLDADMQNVLAKQGLGVDDRPAAGASIKLRSTANISRGGTLVDCTAQLHPDNRDMAEALARCFHLDAAGIDFITPDISRSWREVDCAVIEINATPGFSSDARATQILQARFPAGCDGRIRTVVLVGGDESLLAEAGRVLQAEGACVGMTDSRRTLLAGRERFASSATRAERVRGLLLDAACDALLVGTTPAEIESLGFPLDRCSLALLAAGTELSAPLRKLVEACATRVVTDVTAADLAQVLSGKKQ